jgi:hypothetical protein
MLEIKVDELEEALRPRRAAEKTMPSTPKTFFSTSFARSPENSQQLKLIQDVFSHGFELIDGTEITGGRQLGKIIRGIRKCDTVLVEVTNPVPNVLIEIGLAFGFAKTRPMRIFPLFNTDARNLRELPDFLRTLDIITYGFSPDSLRQARDKVLEKVQVEPEPEELMRVNIKGNSLHPRPDKDGIFVYWPKKRRVWNSMTDELRDTLQKAGLRLYTGLAAPAGSGVLEEIIYGVCRSAPGTSLSTSCFIDTTCEEGVDLVGSFALGVALAEKKGVMRLVEAGHDHADRLSLWTEHTMEWDSAEQLAHFITEKARASKKRKKRARK